MSKFSLDVLNSKVFPHIKTEDPDVILGAAFGEDVALSKVGNDILVSHLDPIVGAIEGIGWLSVHVACNDIAATGIPPDWILVLVLVPSPEDEELLGEIMQDASRAAEEAGVTIIGGHTGYSPGIKRPLVATTAFGRAGRRKPVLTGGARPGDYIIVTGGIALEGTAILATDFSEIAKKLGLNKDDIDKGKNLYSKVSVMPESIILGDNGAHSMHDVTRGGLLETLLEISKLSEVSLSVNYPDIPIPNIVQKFSKAFDFDPLKMISSGTLACTFPPQKKEQMETALKNANIVFNICGKVEKGEGVLVKRDNKTEHYTRTRCEEDELARMWEKYPRDNTGD